jgi:MFS family permease
MGVSQGLFSTLVAECAPPDIRGTAFGLYNLATGLALLAASVVAGALWEAAGPRATFLAGALFAGATLAALVPLRARLPGRPALPKKELS